jgi:hypothetical protein
MPANLAPSSFDPIAQIYVPIFVKNIKKMANVIVGRARRNGEGMYGTGDARKKSYAGTVSVKTPDMFLNYVVKKARRAVIAE